MVVQIHFVFLTQLKEKKNAIDPLQSADQYASYYIIT
jgi:hypothetical protein